MRKCLRSLLALLLLLCLPLSAAAHPVPDGQKDGQCSITVTMTYRGKALKGGTLALYKVGDVAEEDGKVTFPQLPFGLYLVVQKTAPAGYSKTEPFLVSLPYLYEGEYQYDVASEPKTDLEREVPTKPTSPPTKPTPSSGGGKLPQTGQLWWPVPVLTCGGLGCIVVGLLRRRRDGDED